MFNWFQKNILAVKAAPEREVAVSQDGDSINPLAIGESKAFLKQGNTHLEDGKLDEAADCYRQAIARNPHYADACTNLGYVLQMQGNLDEAVALYRKAVVFNPNLLMAHQNLGFVLLSLGQSDVAEESLRRAIALDPEHATALQSLGMIAAQRGDFSCAETLLRRSIELQPDYVDAHNNLGNLLQLNKRFPEAESSYRRAVELKPDYAEAHYNLGNLLTVTKRLSEAESSYRRTVALKPGYTEAHISLGNAFKDLGRLDEAVASYRSALAIKSDFADAHVLLGNVLKDLGKLDEAVTSYRRALEIRPDFAEVHSNLGNALKNLCQLDGAAASYRRALEIKPDYADAYSNLLFLDGYHALIDPHEYLSLARGWERDCLPAQDRQAARYRIFNRLPLAGRRLRVGYVSGDFRQHPVSYFIEQLFAHHELERIELFAYSTNDMRDAVTERLQSLVEHWVSLAGMTNSAILEKIEADRIDVLIDLSGHTGHNRLGVFARRAAPVQAYYLGYFASTGLTEMDYWIGDETLTPPETDSHFSEQVWRLPRVSWSYGGKDAPLPGWSSALDGTVWVGSFNNLGKLTPATLAIWAKLLHALPEGRLLLKTQELADVGNRMRILNDMATHGISPDRIELQDSRATPDWFSHMAYYNRLDIALDPVGAMGGVTTTCDTLWMGVPVITLEGDRVTSRATASILNAIGHPEWISRSEEEYVDKVVALARDVVRRKALRSSQRDTMACSPLCDARGLAKSLENAYFEMFERWRAAAVVDYKVSCLLHGKMGCDKAGLP